MRARRRAAAGDQRGVTLVELLVVVAVGGLLAVPVGGWVISTLGHQDASQHLLRNAVGSGRLAAAFSRDVAGASSVTVDAAGDCDGGGPGSGGNVIMAMASSSAPGQVIYTEADSDGDGDFTSIWRRECDASGALVPGRATELFERVVPGTVTDESLADRRVRLALTPCPSRPIEAARACDPALGSTSPVELLARMRVTPGYEEYSGNGPLAQIQVDPRVGYRNTTFNFDASESRGIDGAAVTWTFPDGSTATGATATKQFGAEGEHEVRVTLTSDAGTTSAVVTVRVVNRYPVAVATAAQTADGFLFDGTGSSHPDGLALDYHWDFGGEDTAGTSQVTRTFEQLGGAGRRRAVLWVTDSEGNADSASVVVEIPGEPPPPVGPITIDPRPAGGDPPLVGTVGPGRAPLPVTFGSDDPATDWTWRLTRLGSPEVVATAPSGDYTYLFGENAHGAYEIARIAATGDVIGPPSPFRVNAAPRAAFDVQTAGPGAPTRFVGEGAGGSVDPDGAIESWRWDFGTGGAQGTGANPTHVYPAPGTYLVRLTVRDSDGEESTFERLVRIPGTPPAPAPPTWTATGVTWPAVPGAEGYRVTMWCTVGAPYVADVPPSTRDVAVPAGYCAGGALWATLQVRANDVWSAPSERSDR